MKPSTGTRHAALLAPLSLIGIDPLHGEPGHRQSHCNVVTLSETQAISMGRSEGRRVRQQYGSYEDAELQPMSATSASAWPGSGAENRGMSRSRGCDNRRARN